MKTTSLKMLALMILLIGAFLACFRSDLQAQPNKNPTLSTNWIGYIVFGQKEAGDPIAGHRPFPTADDTLQLGLRSDGIVVWRRVPSEK
jgi:hypothetical protein